MTQAGEIVRSLPYPVLEDGNLSYPQGQYTVETRPQAGGVSVIIHHQVQGAPFLDRLFREGKSQYGCLVSVPLTGYRRLHLSNDARQPVEWDIGLVGEPPLLRPIIISVADFSCWLGPDDGVTEAWQNREVTFPKGARLALRGYLKAYSSLNELLEINLDPNLPMGSFEVQKCSEEGFYFKVSAASDLFEFLQDPGGHKDHRGSILTHVTSRCFEILKEDYGQSEEDGEWGSVWRQFRNLVALSDELKEKNLPLWDEEGFSADKVSTRLYPHRPSVSEAEE